MAFHFIAEFSKSRTDVDARKLLPLVKGPIHDQSCCATLRVVQHD
jgi:hypothetical protein